MPKAVSAIWGLVSPSPRVLVPGTEPPARVLVAALTSLTYLAELLGEYFTSITSGSSSGLGSQLAAEFAIELVRELISELAAKVSFPFPL